VPKRLPSFLRRAPAPKAEARGILGEELWWPPASSAGVAVTEDTALRLPALLAAIAGLAEDVGSLPLNVYQAMPDGSRRDAREHPCEELLTRSPDGETTPICWRAAFVGHALKRGNGYAEIQRRGNGRPYALHLLDPRTTRPERRNGALGYTLADGRRLAPGDVLHLAGFGEDGLSGLSFVKLLTQGIGVGLASESYAADYFANGAEPGGVIEDPRVLKDEAKRQYREDWQRLHGGPGRRHTPALLQGGAKWNPTSVDPEKSQLVETRKFQANDVTRPWRVPPHKYGDFSQAHLANIEASNLDYLQTALMWWLRGLEQQCGLKLFTREEWAAGFYVEHNVNALLRGDITARFNAYGKALNDGWMNRDQVRRRENMDPIGAAAGGETYFVPLNMVPLDQAGTPQVPARKPAKDPAPSEPSLDPAAPPQDTAPAAGRSGTWLDGNQMFSLKRIINDVALGELPADAAWAMIAASFPGLAPDEIDAMLAPLAGFTPKSVA
jgi:HK97 family phage portal protein